MNEDIKKLLCDELKNKVQKESLRKGAVVLLSKGKTPEKSMYELYHWLKNYNGIPEEKEFNVKLAEITKKYDVPKVISISKKDFEKEWHD